ncbi:protein SSH4 [Scheffersomyces coipomensis]|uniref:protein SSH4 n=1 Tax=Scheffersomyces coipomensis TaxID=1788519 RepID=UPI00315CFFBA
MAIINDIDVDPTALIVSFIFFCSGIALLLFLCIYRFYFTNLDRSDYTFIGSDFLGSSSSNDVPSEFLNDEERLRHLEDTFDFTNLSPEEQQGYLKGEEFTKINPPNFQNIRGKSFTFEDEKLIKDVGTNAFYFEPDSISLNPRYIVADKTELNFHNNDTPYSTSTAILNYALPSRNRLYSDTIYFETKIFEFNPQYSSNSHFSIGLVTKPYPSSFRLPGYNKFSIGYESTGNLKINKPFPTPLQQHLDERSEFNALVLPPLQQSDVVGFGYVIPTGTIFITRNGKKVLDVMRGCFVDLYPAVGCFSTNAKFQVNIGQSGFVWIEANVRKYGFVSTNDYKKLGGDRGLAALPQYNKVIENKDGGDEILDKGEDLPPRYPEDELDFFGRSVNDIVRIGSSSKAIGEKITSGEKNYIDDEDDDQDNEYYSSEDKQPGSSSTITNEPEEIMDLRERIYEQQVTSNSIPTESTPLISKVVDVPHSPVYNSMVTDEGVIEGSSSREASEVKPDEEEVQEEEDVEEHEQDYDPEHIDLGSSSASNSRSATPASTGSSSKGGVRSNKLKKKKKKTTAASSKKKKGKK